MEFLASIGLADLLLGLIEAFCFGLSEKIVLAQHESRRRRAKLGLQFYSSTLVLPLCLLVFRQDILVVGRLCFLRRLGLMVCGAALELSSTSKVLV